MIDAISLWAQAARAAWQWVVVWDAAACVGILAAVWCTIRGALHCGDAEPSLPEDGAAGASRWTWAVLAVITVLGLAMRLHGRAAVPYWWDELLAVWMAQADVPVLLRSLFTPAAPASDFTPPLFYLLLHGWTAAFGHGENEARVLTALFSTVQIPLLGLLGRRLFSWRVGLAAAFLLAISPPVLFYAQQVRCYALLGLLAVASALCAARALETGRRRDVLVLGATGTLFLYTHYVASWLWLGLGAATLTAVGAAWLPEALVGQARKAGRGSVVLAGLGLTALCPFFDPPLLKEVDSLAGILVATGLAALMLSARPWSPSARRGPGFAASMSAAFAVPGLLLCLWMVPSGVVTVIGGPGSRIPGSYGIPEFAGMLQDFTGPQAVLEPSMQGLGLFLALSGLYLALAARPRQALLLLGWAAFPMAMAMAVQNPSMNLVRYLIATLPAVLLLVAAGLCGACDGLGLAVRRLAGARLPGVAALAAPVLLGAAMLGYRAYTATAFTATRANVERYPEAAAVLAKEQGFFLAAGSQNLVRALSWYLDRQGRAGVEFGPGSPRLVAANVFLDGRFWHPEAESGLGLAGARPLEGGLGEIALFRKNTPPPVAMSIGGVVTLHGEALRDGVASGRDVAYAAGNAGGLIQLFKKRPGLAVYRLRHGRLEPGTMTLSLEGMVAGPGSGIEVRLRDGSGAVLLVGELGERGLHAVPGLPGEATGGAVAVRLARPLHPGEVDLEVSLYDDNTGVIYSSNVILRSLTLTLPFPKSERPGGE